MPLPPPTDAAPRPRGRPRSNRDAVYRATEHLIAEHGVRQVTMEAIAEAAGVSKVTLYRAWGTRSTLLAQVLLRQLEQAAPLDPDGDPPAELRRHAVRFMDLLQGDLGRMLRELVIESLGSDDAGTAFREHYLARRRAVAIGLIARGLRSGRLAASGSAEALHDALYGAFFYRFLFGVGRLDARAARALVDTILQPAPGVPPR